MTKRQRLLARALRLTKCSPEQFAQRYAATAAHYSGRQLRRFLAGAPMPDHLVAQLTTFVHLLRGDA